MDPRTLAAATRHSHPLLSFFLPIPWRAQKNSFDAGRGSALPLPLSLTFGSLGVAFFGACSATPYSSSLARSLAPREIAYARAPIFEEAGGKESTD